MPEDLDSVRIAMVQPLTAFGEDARERNLAEAEARVAEAAREGASLVCFPETFPGAWRAPVTWTPEDDLARLAHQHGVYVVGGFAEPIDGDVQRCFNTLGLYGPEGKEVGRYRRTTPRHDPWIYKSGNYWDFEWVKANKLPVFQTDIGPIGILMCSEVYAPELARAMALQGALLTLLPAGLPGPHGAKFATWKTLVWARAIENLMYTAACSNIPADGPLDTRPGRAQGGLLMVCSPEEVVQESQDPGVHITDLDLARIRELREAEDSHESVPRPWAAKPGNLRDWRRDAVLKANPVLLSGTQDPEHETLRPQPGRAADGENQDEIEVNAGRQSRISPLHRKDLSEFEDWLANREEQFGYIPNSIFALGRAPGVLSAFLRLSSESMGAGRVDTATKSLVALMRSSAAGCQYCEAHTASRAIRSGVDSQKLQAIWDFETSDLFGEGERAALRLARDAAQQPPAVDDSHFESLRCWFDEDQITEIMTVICLFAWLNSWNDCVGTDLEETPRALARRYLGRL